MRKQRLDAVSHIAAELLATETAIDAALAQVGRLATALPTARSTAGLSAVVGQDAMERAGQTLSALLQARRGIVETHHELSNIQAQIGLRTYAVGGLGDKPPATDIAQTGRHLRSVEDGREAA